LGYYANENWEIDEIVDKEFRICGTTRSEVINEYLGARTLVNQLVESGDLSYGYEEFCGVQQLQYQMSEKAEGLIRDLDYIYFMDSMRDFE